MLESRAVRRKVVPASAVLCSAALVLPGPATDAWTLGAALALLSLAASALCAPALLRPDPAPVGDAPAAPGDTGARRRISPRIRILAALAFALMLCEGVANDWSALDLKDVLGVPAATAALAYGSYATAMTVGRLLADRVAARVGAVAVLRYGSALAALGLTSVALAPNGQVLFHAADNAA